MPRGIYLAERQLLRPSPTRFDPTDARRRIVLTYAYRHRRLPDLELPRRFTELVQHRKLHDRSPGQSAMADKLATKTQVARTLGRDWVVPLAWSGTALPATLPTNTPAILKARHGCDQNRVLRRPPSGREWAALRRTAAGWTARPYGLWLDEWAYRDVPRGLLLEPLIGTGPDLPTDYKVFVFGGRATHVQVHLGRGAGQHRWILHDRDWRSLVPGEPVARPRSLPAMLAAAEQLAGNADFLRVDFYEVGGRPVFGEFCLYPGSGLDPFPASWIDYELGALWLAVQPVGAAWGQRHAAGRSAAFDVERHDPRAGGVQSAGFPPAITPSAPVT